MQLHFSAEELAFRKEVRSFLEGNLPEHVARHQLQGFMPTREDMETWHRILYKKGWAAPEWPVAYGGTGWSPVQKFIYEIEYGLANAPDISVPGIHLVGPLICEYGSEGLKERILGPLLRGELYFAQGFSEPQAGSDLANLKTRAMRSGDDYVINGQKIWTSEAHFSDYVFALVRTNSDVKPQAGLSMILIPLDAPGVTVRPIVTIDDCHHVNEVFFEDVRVPAANRIGEENMAWTYAKFLLDSERTYNAHIGRLYRNLGRIRELGRLQEERGQSVMNDSLRNRLARIEFDVTALAWSVLRVLAAEKNTPDLGAAASALKVRGSDLLMRTTEMELEVAGLQGLPRFNRADGDSGLPLGAEAGCEAPGLMAQFLYWRASSIFGGSNDIQRSIIWNSIAKK